MNGKTEEAQSINRRLTLIKGDLHKKHLQLEVLGKPITGSNLNEPVPRFGESGNRFGRLSICALNIIKG